MPYSVVKTILTLAIAAGLALASLQSNPLYAGLAIAAGVAVFVLMLSRKGDVLAEAAKREQRAADRARERKREVMKSAPLLSILILAACGIAFTFWTFNQYPTSHGGFIRRLLYSTLGETGMTLLFAFGAAFMFVMAIEMVLGMLLARES